MSPEAVEAAWAAWLAQPSGGLDGMRRALTAAAPFIRASEREACARVAEQRAPDYDKAGGYDYAEECRSIASAIRSRTEPK